MDRLTHTKVNAQRRAHKVAAKIHGSAERPRLAVHISNLHISAQLIDDEKGVTLAAVSSVGKKMTGTMSQKAEQIGTEIAAKAKKAKLKKVVFDRASRKYHG